MKFPPIAFAAVALGLAVSGAFTARLALSAYRVASAPATSSGLASWYGDELRGARTASGEPFNPDRPTCASWDHPFGTILEVSANGRTVLVRVNDRGPAKRLNRVLDLSRSAFAQLEDPRKGVVQVTFSVKD